jgi:hypothetical protein
MATENWLWGAPRIHGELLKLGFTVSERTVSRYLRDRPTRRSQTWRTFLANHVGNLAVASTVTPTFAMNTDDAQSSVLPWRPLSWDGLYASNEWAFADSLPPLQSPSLRSCTTPAQLHASTQTFQLWQGSTAVAGPPCDWHVRPIPELMGFRLDWVSIRGSRRKLATLWTHSGLAHRWQTDTTFSRALKRKPIGDDSRNIGEAQLPDQSAARVDVVRRQRPPAGDAHANPGIASSRSPGAVCVLILSRVRLTIHYCGGSDAELPQMMVDVFVHQDGPLVGREPAEEAVRVRGASGRPGGCKPVERGTQALTFFG